MAKTVFKYLLKKFNKNTLKTISSIIGPMIATEINKVNTWMRLPCLIMLLVISFKGEGDDSTPSLTIRKRKEKEIRMVMAVTNKGRIILNLYPREKNPKLKLSKRYFFFK
jgi:hypothetical protein